MLFISSNCCPEGAISSTGSPGHCFLAITEADGWYYAGQDCQDKYQGNLASIHNAQDNIKLALMFGSITSFFIGCSYNNIKNEWTWSDGTLMDYNASAKYLNSNSGDCCYVNTVDGIWYSTPCSDSKPYACMIPDMDSTPASSCPNGSFPSWNAAAACFTYHSVSLSWEQAEAQCLANNGHLASITIEGDETSLLGYIAEHSGLIDKFWIGGNNFNKDRTWQWSDGSNFTLNYWPANHTFTNLTNDDCIAVHISNKEWFPTACTEANPYFCLTLLRPLPTSSVANASLIPTTLIPSTASTNFGTLKPSTSTIPATTAKFTVVSTTPKPTTLSTTESVHTSTPSIFTTSTIYNPTNANSDSTTKYYIIGGVVLIIITIIVVAVIQCWRKRRQQGDDRAIQENIRAKFEASPLEAQLSHDERMRMQLEPRYVNVDFNNVLGQGSNATVYQALIKGETRMSILKKSYKSPQYVNCEAAYKVPTTFDIDEVETFVRELDALITFGSHPHIIAFLGWSLYHETPALITELAQSNLLAYVKNLRGQELPYKLILSYLWQISQALEYIATFSMVHRDVACRNVLLTGSNTAKLADFGLCCHCDESFTYRASLQKRFPLKWLSIEALVDRLFSEKSDVWSFGILCYEIFTYGAVPYPALTNVEMLDFLREGKRLEKPEAASGDIYDLMLRCWREEPGERPKFEEIGKVVRSLLESETAGYGYLTLDLENITVVDET